MSNVKFALLGWREASVSQVLIRTEGIEDSPTLAAIAALLGQVLAVPVTASEKELAVPSWENLAVVKRILAALPSDGSGVAQFAAIVPKGAAVSLIDSTEDSYTQNRIFALAQEILGMRAGGGTALEVAERAFRELAALRGGGR